MTFRGALCCLLVLAGLTGVARAAPTDDIADALVDAGAKPISSDSLPADFARLARLIPHDANGMVLYADGGSTDGYVRHAEARFDKSAMPHGGPSAPLFSVAFEMVDQQDFTFEGLAAALDQRLGTPITHSDQIGATFRTWLLKSPQGRSLTIARAQASDNGDPITVVQLIQQR